MDIFKNTSLKCKSNLSFNWAPNPGLSQAPFGLKLNSISAFELEENNPKRKPNLIRERIRLKKQKEEEKKRPKKILKIADFGLSRSCTIPVQTLTNEVVTLWYRSPELLLGDSKYNQSCDIWSVGCIFAEMITNRPLLMGKNVEEQLEIVFGMRGSPEVNNWMEVAQLKGYVHGKWFDYPKRDIGQILSFTDKRGASFDRYTYSSLIISY